MGVVVFFVFFSRQPPPRATVHFETTRSSSVGILLQIPGVGCFFVITTLYTDTAYRAPTKEVRLGFTRTPGVPAQVQYHVYCILMSYFFLGNTAFFRVRPQAGPASLFLTLVLINECRVLRGKVRGTEQAVERNGDITKALLET